MDGSLFFPLGIGLVVVALVLSAIGIRGKASFPPSRPALIGLTVLFAAVVVATGSLARVNAKDEQEHRNEELAEGQEHAEAEQPPPPPKGAPAPGGGPTAGAEVKLDLTSPADGSLAFDPDGLQARPGLVTLAYDNPSPVTHNINIEGDGGTLAESEDVTDGAVEVRAQLGPGEYVFYCSIPGHREGGMEGDLVVK